jgi:hypothetical protein
MGGAQVWLQSVHADRLLAASNLHYEIFTAWPNHLKWARISWGQGMTTSSSQYTHHFGNLEAQIRETRRYPDIFGKTWPIFK